MGLSSALLCCLLAAPSAPSSPAAASRNSENQRELPANVRAFAETIDVRVVNLEAVVTDKDGRRVPGLKPDVFRLRVDGKVVPIEYFTEVREGQAVEPAQDGTPETSPVPQIQEGEAVGTRYLVFIDDYFSIAAERNRVLERLTGDLTRLPPEDQVAIVAFDGRRLELLTSWTGRAEAIHKALAAAMARTTYGLHLAARRQSMLSGREDRDRERKQFAESLGPGQALTMARAIMTDPTGQELEYAGFLTEQLESEVMAATAALRGLAPGPGRRVALLLSGGWTFDAVGDTSDEPTSDSTEAGLPRGQDLYRPLTETANLLGFTLYPVDVRGLEGVRPSIGTFSRGGPGEGAILEDAQQYVPAQQQGAPDVVPLLPEHAVQATFLHLAAQTGGKAMLNDLRDVALARTVEDTRSYYWLGFTAPRSGDGEAHKIELEVLRPGLQVRSRKSYLDLTREQEVTASVESLLLFPGGGEASQVEPLPIRPGPPHKADRKTIELPLTLGIPVGKVTMLPHGKSWVGDLELRVASLDEDGGRSEMPVIPLHLEAQRKPSADGLIRYDTRLALRRVPQELVVAVYDPVTGKLLASRLEIDPEAALRAARRPGR